MAGRDGLRREAVDHLEERVPAGVGQHRGAGLARAAGAFLATGRQFEGDARAPRRRRRGAGAAARGAMAVASGVGPSTVAGIDSVDLGQSQVVARRARRAARHPPGSRCRAGCPRTRSGRSRRGSSARPCRAAGRRGRRCSTGSARSRSTRAAGRRRVAAGRTRRSGRAPTSRARAVIDAAPRPRRPRHRARCSGWCSGLGASHQPVLSGPAVARSRSTFDVDQRRATGRQRATDRRRDLGRVARRARHGARRHARCRRRRGSRASRPASGNRSRPSARRTSPGRP